MSMTLTMARNFNLEKLFLCFSLNYNNIHPSRLKPLKWTLKFSVVKSFFSSDFNRKFYANSTDANGSISSLKLKLVEILQFDVRILKFKLCDFAPKVVIKRSNT